MSTLDPIAVIGYAYRAPGAGRKHLWHYLEQAKCAWSPVPHSRFEHAAFYNPDKDKAGCIASEGGHFLPGHSHAFEPAFFNLRAEEARHIDPQQRTLLECAFEAAEHAGVTINQLAGSNVGVFAAMGHIDHALQVLSDLPTTSKYTATGTACCMYANRLSYFFDLRGPSVTLDTACASSSTALHFAVQNLRAHECEAAFVAASTLAFSPHMFTTLDTMGALSPEGKCHSYGSNASGYGRADGAGCLLLKPLSKALRDNDYIHAIVANTACNHGGRTDGITVPSQDAQMSVLRRVHEEIGWNPADTTVVEGHGTGTAIGDPIEVRSVASVFGHNRSPSNPVFLGSIKSNIGHSENSSGVLAVIKSVMMLQHSVILPTVGADSQSPVIEAPGVLRVLQSPQPWPRDAAKRVCVSNFGFGGSNACVLLEGYESRSRSNGFATSRAETNGTVDLEDVSPAGQDKMLFAFSARTEASLRAYTSSFAEYLKTVEHPSPDLVEDLCYTLGQRRTHFQHRLAIPADSIGNLKDQLQLHELTEERLLKTKKVHIAFLFTGQGVQYPGMGVGLARFPAFISTLVRAEKVLQSLGCPWLLRDELQKPARDSQINEASVSQPASTAVQLALVELLRSWNVLPAIVAGHSSGEIAAAYTAGLVSFETAIALAYCRGQAAARVAESAEFNGTMLALGASADEASSLLSLCSPSGYATIAAINSPTNVTVSGDVTAIDEIQRTAVARGLFAKRLNVGVAYHSKHIASFAECCFEQMKPIFARPSENDRGENRPVFVSSVSGKVQQADTVDLPHWVRNALQPVLMVSAIETVFRQSYTAAPNLVIEIGAHSALKVPFQQTLEASNIDQSLKNVTYLPTLTRGASSADALLAFASLAFAAGVDLDLASVNRINSQHCQVVTNMPAYEWDKSERYEHLSRAGQSMRWPGQPYHALLGWASACNEGKSRSFRQVFTLDEMPWLRDHKISGDVLYPMAGYLALCFEAVRAINPSPEVVGSFVVREFHAVRGLQIAEDEVVDITTKLSPLAIGSNAFSPTWWAFEIMSWTQTSGWTTHCHGRVKIDASAKIKTTTAAAAATLADREDLHSIDTSLAYKTMATIGLDYGPGFALITGVAWTADVAVFRVKMWELLNASNASGPAFELASSIATSDNILHGAGLLKALNGRMQGSVPAYCRHLRFLDKVPVDDATELTVVTRIVSEDEKLGSVTVCATAFVRDTGSLVPVAELTHLVSRSFSDMTRPPQLQAETYDWQLSPFALAADSALTQELGVAIAVTGVLHDTTDQGFAQKVSDRVSNTSGYSAKVASYLDVAVDAKVHLVFIENRHESVTSSLNESTFERLRQLVLGSASIVWIIPQDSAPEAHTMVGFLRSMRLEDPSRPLILIKDVRLDEAGASLVAQIVSHLATEGPSLLAEQEFVVADGVLCVPRLRPTPNAAATLGLEEVVLEKRVQSLADRGNQSARDTLQMTVDAVGSLDSIFFRRVDLLAEKLGDDEIIINIVAVGVNFRDLLLVLGSVPWHEPGLEGSGVVVDVGSRVTHLQRGDRVFYGFTQAGFANYVRIPACFAQKVPGHLSFAQAATIPVAYSTAMVSLRDIAQLRAGESVLIHAATGAVGQACVAVAESIGATIFATAGTPAKRSFLHQIMGVPVEHIFSSRTADFHDEILLATEGRGVDVVVNSLSGELLERTWDVLADFGRFVEIGKKDILENNYLGLRHFERNITFRSLDLRQLMQKKPADAAGIMADISRLVNAGALKPIQVINEVSLSDLAAGLRLMQTGDNIGKMVVTISAEDSVLAEPPVTPEPAQSLLSGDSTYIITGGTGGIGRSLALWMMDQGAKHILLLGRSGDTKPEVANLVSKHNDIRAISCDVGSRASLEKALDSIRDWPQVRGVVHGAMDLRDALLVNTTFGDWQRVTVPKINAAWHLHELLPNLDFFISLASVAGVVGNVAQTIYAGTTTFLEAFSAYRRQLGLPAISIQLPVIDDAGYAQERGLAISIRQDSGVWLKTRHVERLVKEAIVASRTGQQECITRATAFIRDQHNPTMTALGKRWNMYSALRQAATKSFDQKPSSRYSSAESFLPALMERVATLATMDVDEVDPDTDLIEYSLDSLVTIELRNWIKRETGSEVAMSQVLKMPNLRALAESIFAHSPTAE